MTLKEKLELLPSNATIGFKWQDANGNWKAESDGYTVAELKAYIEAEIQTAILNAQLTPSIREEWR